MRLSSPSHWHSDVHKQNLVAAEDTGKLLAAAVGWLAPSFPPSNPGFLTPKRQMKVESLDQSPRAGPISMGQGFREKNPGTFSHPERVMYC